MLCLQLMALLAAVKAASGGLGGFLNFGAQPTRSNHNFNPNNLWMGYGDSNANSFKRNAEGFNTNFYNQISGRSGFSDSPCPDVFSYHYENGQMQYGEIRVKSPGDNVVELTLEISVGNEVKDYNGDLDLTYSKEKTVRNIMDTGMIDYRVDFPRWYNIPPKVTKIILNNRIICQGPPIDINSVKVLTTINLQHTLRLSVPISTIAGAATENQNPNSNTNLFLQFGAPPQSTSVNGVTNYPNNPFFSPGSVNFNNNDNPPVSINSNSNFNPVFGNERPQMQPQPPPQLQPRPQPQPRPEVFSPPIQRNEINDPICGTSVNSNSLIVQGEETKKGEYPWLTAIFRVKTLGPEFLCGGSLISHRHVVTAGHCVKQGDRVLPAVKVFVRLGQHNLHDWTQMQDTIAQGVSRIAVHPQYKPLSADADLAVLVMVEDVGFTTLVRPICLWDEDRNLDRVVGSVGIVAGWGKDESNNQVSPIPKQVKFPIVSQADCLRSHQTFREITSERTFCGGFKNGSGPCNGDSGSGFLLRRNNRWTLRGVTSHSISKDRTCDFFQYFVFTDITNFMDWILEVIRTPV